MKIEEKIELLEETIIQMAKRVRVMYASALDVLITGDKERALHIIESDEFVNNDEEEVNQLCVVSLSLLQPVAKDLRTVIASIKIATDLERIGDYAKNIARHVIKNDALPKELHDHSTKIGQMFLELYDATIQAYIEKDIKAVYQIPSMDDQIDQSFKIMAELLESLLLEKRSIVAPVATIGTLRNIERAGDHTKNICEHIIYQIKGQHVDFG